MGVINKTTAEINTLLDKVEGMPDEGVSGKTPVLETGSTTTLDPGQNATSEVVANGTDESGNPKYKLNFGIPRGYDGSSTGGVGVADSVQWANVLNKPTWVNSATKPTYTATEVGALPVGTIIPSKTSQLTNDSNYVTSSTLKTINGQSIVGAGNIEISGTGSGIADAPSDGKIYGRKNGAWASITSSTGGSVDISDIMQRIGQLSEIEGTCTDEDYNTLKGYADNGTVTYANQDGESLIINVKNSDGTISLLYEIEYVNVLSRVSFVIDSSKKVSLLNNNFYSANAYGLGLLGDYNKPSSYSAITKDDSISKAIGKLEAGIGTGSSSDDIYYLPTAVLTLDTQATNEEIEAAFGGLDKRTELVNAIKAGKKIYIQENSTYGAIPVSTYSFLNTIVYISFIKAGLTGWEIVNISFAPNSAIKVINGKGYKVKSSINTLTDSSSTEDISNVLDGYGGVKELIKAAEDGNNIYTNMVIDGNNFQGRIPLGVAASTTDDICSIIINGVQGESGLESFSTKGILSITYHISSNTFECVRINI